MYHMKRPRKFRSSKLSEAVFRGKRLLYTFDVYPLAAKDITDGPAVFILSRRHIDRFGSGHHSAICIGETDSIVSEIKHHKRSKCVKEHGANVVCLLKEPSEGTRAGLVEDLTSARRFSCVQNAYDTTIRPKPNVKPQPIFHPVTSRRRRPAKPSQPAEAPSSSKRANGGPASRKPKKTKPAKAAGGVPKRRGAAEPARAGRWATPVKKTRSAAKSRLAAVTPVKSKTAKPRATRTGSAAAKSVSTLAERNVVPAGPAKRVGTKGRTAGGKPAAKTGTRAGAVGKKTANTKTQRRPVAPKGKRKTARPANAEGRTRIQVSLDRDRKQHRLSDKKGPSRRTAKTRASGRTRPRTKTSA